MKLTLTYIERKERTSARTGKPFTSLTIKAKEYGDKFLSGFGNKSNEGWVVGMEVEVAEVKEVVKDGKTYLNFEMPKHGNVGDLAKRLEHAENMITKLGLSVASLEAAVFPNGKISGTNEPYPQDHTKTAFDDKNPAPVLEDEELESLEEMAEQAGRTEH